MKDRALCLFPLHLLGAGLLWGTSLEAQAQTWLQTTPVHAPSRRSSSGAAFDELRGRVVLFGGYDVVTPGLGDLWEWDGQDWLQRTPTGGPSARWGQAMVYDSKRRHVVLFGGFQQGFGYRADTWTWNGTSWTLRAPAAAPSARANHGMVFDRTRGKAVLLGGFQGGASYVGDTWTWDGANWSLQTTPVAPSARRDPAMAFDELRQEVVLFGGGSGSAVSQDTWIWNGASWASRAPVGSPPARMQAQACFDQGAGRVVLHGGLAGTFVPLADTWEWDGTTWTAANSPGPVARHAQTMVFDSWRGNTLLFGGEFSSPWPQYPVAADTWQRVPVLASSWRPASTSGPSLRSGAAMAFDAARGTMVLAGGIYANGLGHTYSVLDDTWRWNGTAWVSAGLAPMRAGHAMAYDSARARIVQFGGLTGSYPLNTVVVGGTWEWDGLSWTAVNVPVEPAPRTGHAMAYDPVRGVVVLWGGGGGQSGSLPHYGDTWEWNGLQWQMRNPTTAPPAAPFAAMAFDGGLSRCVCYTSASTATWEWDGVNWTAVGGPGPGARSGHAMAWDVSHGCLVLFGGFVPNSNVVFSDTWERYGQVWLRIATGGPRARLDTAVAYDSLRQDIVLFGGDDSISWPLESKLGDTWVYESGPQPLNRFAHALPYGAGCGATPLTFAPDTRPRLGITVTSTIGNLPATSTTAFVAMGFDARNLGAAALPLSLAGVGMPGCDLWQSADLGLANPTTPVAGGGFRHALAIPNSSAFLGLHAYVQAWAPAPGANAAGIVVSNGIAWQFGDL